MKRRTLLTTALVAILAVSSACSEDPAFLAGRANIIIGFQPTGGSYSARVNGQTYSGVGGFPVSFNSVGETHEITGTFTGVSLTIYFATTTSSGVQSRSLTSLAGPSPRILDCEITYVAPSAGTHEFRLRFLITGTSALVCP